MRLAIVLLACCVSSPAVAQTAGETPVHRLEVSAGGGWFGGAGLGERDANLRANDLEPRDFRLFASDVRLAAAPLLEVRAGFALSSRVAIEGRFGLSHPELQAGVSSDAEDGDDLTVVADVDQYVFDGGIVLMLDELRVGGLVPFASGGAGYVRQLYEGLTVVENGYLYYLGGGAKYRFFSASTGLLRSAGVRGDARLNVFFKGVALDDGARPQGAISASMFLVF